MADSSARSPARRGALVLPALLTLVLVLGLGVPATPPARAGTTTAVPAQAPRRVRAAAGTLVAAASKTAASVVAATTTTTSSPPTTTNHAASGQQSSQSASASQSTNAAPSRDRASAPLHGWLGDGAVFPDRVLVLSAPAGRSLAASSLRVTENGVAVTGATVTPLARAGAGDLATMLVIDQSQSMAGAPLAAAMRAARGLATVRRGRQELGLITFDAAPSVFLHPSSDRRSISTVLSATPWTGDGANVPAAITVALRELSKARVALGAVVVISDGRGRLTGGRGPTPASVAKAAAAAHVPIFTVGVQDASSVPATMNALRAASPGEFVASTPASLPGVLRRISATLDQGYVLRYRSQQRAGRSVAVDVTAAGFPGAVAVKYEAPAGSAARPAVSHGRAASAAHSRRHTARIAGAAVLSPTPGFAPPAQPVSFWASSRSLPVVAAIVAVLFTLAVVLVLYRPSQRSVRVRVGSFIPDVEDGHSDPAIDLGLQRSRAPRLLEHGTWWGPFAEDVEIARSPHTPIYLVKRAAVIAVVVAFVVLLVTGSLPLALLPLVLWPFALRMLVTRQARKQRELFADTLPGYLQDLASAMRVGRSFGGSLSVVASSADEPVRGELERAVTDEALGRPIDESLEAVGQRMHSGDIDQVALIASLNRRSGSNVAEALDRVADGARDRADLRREIKALTAQAKMSSLVLTALPPLLLLAITLVSPRYARPLLHTTVGIILLIIGALMVFAGWKVMKKITTIKA